MNKYSADGSHLNNRFPIGGTETLSKDFDYFLTSNSTLTMPDVTGYIGGERFSVVAAIAATSSTLAVNSSQSELIKASNGESDTDFNLTNIGVSFEFVFNATTGNWEV